MDTSSFIVIRWMEVGLKSGEHEPSRKINIDILFSINPHSFVYFEPYQTLKIRSLEQRETGFPNIKTSQHCYHIQGDKKKGTYQKTWITQLKLVLQGWDLNQVKKQRSNVSLVSSGKITPKLQTHIHDNNVILFLTAAAEFKMSQLNSLGNMI